MIFVVGTGFELGTCAVRLSAQNITKTDGEKKPVGRFSLGAMKRWM